VPEGGGLGNVFAVAFANGPCSLAAVRNRFVKNWLPLILWMALIFSASSGAGAPNVSSYFLRPFLHWFDPTMSEHTFAIIHLITRKIAHLTEYAMLGFLAWRTALGEPALIGARWPRPTAVALIFCALYACTDEFHQSFVPGRQASPVDVLIDTFGAAIGLGVTLLVERRRRLR
jgi:VanZ family protein